MQVFQHSTATNTAGWDNLGLSLLAVFQCITLTGWTFITYRSSDGTSPYVIIYFLAMILLGAYFVVCAAMNCGCPCKTVCCYAGQ